MSVRQYQGALNHLSERVISPPHRVKIYNNHKEITHTITHFVMRSGEIVIGTLDLREMEGAEEVNSDARAGDRSTDYIILISKFGYRGI